MNYLMGQPVKDIITSFSGTVTGRAEYITGCTQVLVQPRDPKADGSVIEARWFDESRLTVLPGEVLTIPGETNRDGADAPAPIK